MRLCGDCNLTISWTCMYPVKICVVEVSLVIVFFSILENKVEWWWYARFSNTLTCWWCQVSEPSFRQCCKYSMSLTSTDVPHGKGTNWNKDSWNSMKAWDWRVGVVCAYDTVYSQVTCAFMHIRRTSSFIYGEEKYGEDIIWNFFRLNRILNSVDV